MKKYIDMNYQKVIETLLEACEQSRRYRAVVEKMEDAEPTASRLFTIDVEDEGEKHFIRLMQKAGGIPYFESEFTITDSDGQERDYDYIYQREVKRLCDENTPEELYIRLAIGLVMGFIKYMDTNHPSAKITVKMVGENEVKLN